LWQTSFRASFVPVPYTTLCFSPLFTHATQVFRFTAVSSFKTPLRKLLMQTMRLCPCSKSASLIWQNTSNWWWILSCYFHWLMLCCAVSLEGSSMESQRKLFFLRPFIRVGQKIRVNRLFIIYVISQNATSTDVFYSSMYCTCSESGEMPKDDVPRASKERLPMLHTLRV
jgi:hypothetical protein